MATETACGHHQKVPLLIKRPAGCGRRRLPLSVAPFLVLIIAASIKSSQAFLFPRSCSPISPPLFAHRYQGTSSSSRRSTRNVGRIRSKSTSLSVSLEPAPTEIQELAQHPNGSSRLSGDNATLSNIPALDVVNPTEEADEHHVETARTVEGVEELTHPSGFDGFDPRQISSPSVPVSYDEHGLVQAEAAPPSAEGNALVENGGAVAVTSATDETDYPPLVRFLYTRDSHGQTLASKLVNFVLLAGAFGYVVASVFNIDEGMTRGWSPGEITMRIPLDTWASYEQSLGEKPVATKTIINIVIYLLGDWLSQTLFTGKNALDFDAGRTLKNGFVGMCFGPAVHEYYEFSDWILPVEGLTMGVTNRVYKILMDQTIYLSIKCSIYIMAIGILNGQSPGASSDNVKTRIKPIMFTAWKFWPLVHCVTYGLIPARHRILWVNSVDLVWNAILASKARDDVDDGEEDEEGRDDSVKRDASSVVGPEKKVNGSRA